jgi:hypothetical protein
VVFTHYQLERLLGLERFKPSRISWLLQDLRELFPYQQKLVSPGKGSKVLESLFVSRFPLKEYFPPGRMSTEKHIEGIITRGGPRIAPFRLVEKPSLAKFDEVVKDYLPFFADFLNYDERLLSSYLAFISQGLISARNMPIKFDTGQE